MNPFDSRPKDPFLRNVYTNPYVVQHRANQLAQNNASQIAEHGITQQAQHEANKAAYLAGPNFQNLQGGNPGTNVNRGPYWQAQNLPGMGTPMGGVPGGMLTFNGNPYTAGATGMIRDSGGGNTGYQVRGNNVWQNQYNAGTVGAGGNVTANPFQTATFNGQQYRIGADGGIYDSSGAHTGATLGANNSVNLPGATGQWYLNAQGQVVPR